MSDVQNIDDRRVEPFGKIITITLSGKPSYPRLLVLWETMVAFLSVLLKDEQARAVEPGLCFTEQDDAGVCLELWLCFTEQYNAGVCLDVAPEAFLLADHENNPGCCQLLMHGGYHGFIWKTTFVTEKEWKLITWRNAWIIFDPTVPEQTISARLCFLPADGIDIWRTHQISARCMDIFTLVGYQQSLVSNLKSTLAIWKKCKLPEGMHELISIQRACISIFRQVNIVFSDMADLVPLGATWCW